MQQVDTGADGFNADSMKFVPESYWDAGVAAHHPASNPPATELPV